MTEHVDAVVLGAGFVGTGVARALASRGARVVVLDADPRGGLGSRAAAGVAVPSLRLAADPTLLEFVRAGKTCLDTEVAALEREDPAVRRGRGVLRLALRDPQRQELEETAGGAGIALGRWLPVDELAAAEPLLAGGPAQGGFLDESGYVVDADRYLAAVAGEAAARGADLRLGTAATSVAGTARGAVVEVDGGAAIECGAAVIAAGAWTSRLPGLAELGVGPLRGQALELRPAVEAGGLTHVVSTYLGYLAPGAGGVLVGATEEDAGFVADVTIAGLLHLTSAAARVAPRLRGARFVRAWAGLRSVTPSGRPLIGWLPGAGRVAVATGHGGQGVLTAGLTAAAVAELIERGASDVAAPFDPAGARRT
jgi:glycine oxidase